MTNSVSYKYTPNQPVYVVDTLGNGASGGGQYPYWGFPYGYGACGFPYDWANGSPPAYPNGFTNTTPAIQSGTVLQTRILFTTSNPSVPTIMYDVRINGEMGSTSFPETMVFPATAGVAGSQTVNFAGTLTYNTPIAVNFDTAAVATMSYSVQLTGTTTITKPSGQYTATITINGVGYPISIDLSTTPTVSAFLTALNVQLGSLATASVANGNIIITTSAKGVSATLAIVDTNSPTNLFGNIATAFVGFSYVQGTTTKATTTVYVNGTPVSVAIDLSTTLSVAAFIAAFNNVMATQAVMTLVSGNLVVSSADPGVASSIVIIDPATNPLFGSLPGFVGFNTAVPGVASGLDQAQAYYATLQL